MEKLQILVIEDDCVVAQDLKETLEKAGHEVIDMAKTLNEVSISLKQQLPDVALVDIHLGDNRPDGITIVQEILAHYSIPIIYLTGHSEIPTFERAKETLPAAYMLKPFRKRELALQVELAYYHYKANRSGVAHPAAAEELYLPVSKEKGYEKISKNQVVYIEADGAYVHIFQADTSKRQMITMNLGYLAQFFPSPNFYRLSRSILINLHYLERIEGNEIYMKNYTKKALSIPENSRKDFLKKLPIVRTP